MPSLAAGLLTVHFLYDPAPLKYHLHAEHLIPMLSASVGWPAAGWLALTLARRVMKEWQRARLIMEQRHQELAVVHEVEQAASRGLELSETLGLALDKLTEAVQAEVSGLCLFEDKDKLALTASRGASPEMSQAFRELSNGRLAGLAAAASLAHTLPTRDYPHPELRQLLEREGYRFAALGPIESGGKVLGLLTLGRRTVPFTPADLSSLAAVGRQLGLILERAQLQETLKVRVERRAALNRITFALSATRDINEIYRILTQELEQLLPLDRLAVGLLTPDRQSQQFAYVHSRLPGIASPGSIRALLAGTPAYEAIATGRAVLRPDLVEQSASTIDLTLREGSIRTALSLPLILRGESIGTLNLSSRLPYAYSPGDMEFLQPLAAQLALALEQSRLYQEEREARGLLSSLIGDLKKGQEALQRSYEATAVSLVQILEARDPYTRGHSDRVLHFARLMARRLALSQEDTETLIQAAQLHDLGKIGIRDTILRKPGPLTPAEWAEMKLHPERGAAMLAQIPFLKDALPFILHHQERWDGAGYPGRLAGTSIPFGARLLAVADGYDAMTSERPYRRALTHPEALAELRRGAGTQWDPSLVEALLESFSSELYPVESPDSIAV